MDRLSLSRFGDIVEVFFFLRLYQDVFLSCEEIQHIECFGCSFEIPFPGDEVRLAFKLAGWVDRHLSVRHLDAGLTTCRCGLVLVG